MNLILVVDDEDDLRETVQSILELEGFRTVGACNGLEALERLRDGSERPSLILLDLMMPRMNGWDFRAHQLADPALEGIPVVVMTANGNVELHPLAGRAVEVLRKPVPFDRLLSTVASYLAMIPEAASG